MQIVIIIRDGEYKKGEIVTLQNNDAHRLIDSGQGKLYKNKMLVPEIRTEVKNAYHTK